PNCVAAAWVQITRLVLSNVAPTMARHGICAVEDDTATRKYNHHQDRHMELAGHFESLLPCTISGPFNFTSFKPIHWLHAFPWSSVALKIWWSRGLMGMGFFPSPSIVSGVVGYAKPCDCQDLAAVDILDVPASPAEQKLSSPAAVQADFCRSRFCQRVARR